MKRWLLLTFLTGCMVGPNYKAPENDVANVWHDEADVETPLIAWWKSFEDPLLNQIIESAALNNKDIQKAEAAVLEARALRQVAASDLFPHVNADISAIKTYFSKNGPIFSFAPGGGAGGGTSSAITGLPFSIQIPQIQNLYNALFDASWEIDLFGKTRRTVQAADAHYGSVIEQRNDTLISVLAETARNYMELRSFQKRLDLTELTIQLLEKNSKIVQQQFNYGYANQLQLDYINAQLFAERANLPNITAAIYCAIYNLSLLTGNLPEALLDELLPLKALPKPADRIAVGVRSDLLLRRPDVRGAERNLAEATANVGIAVASFYPRFTLLGDGGFQSLQVKNLFEMGSRTWAYGGDLNMPIFEGFKLIGNLHMARAEEAMAASSYQQTVLSAISEAESTLKTYNESLATAADRRSSSDEYRKIFDLTLARYEKGLVGLLDLLTIEQTLVTSEIYVLDSDTTSLVNLVALYKALGGGWQAEEEPSCNNADLKDN